MTDEPTESQPSPPTRPTWVKVLLIALAAVAAVVIVTALAGDEHGPGRHLPGGGEGGHTPMQHSP